MKRFGYALGVMVTVLNLTNCALLPPPKRAEGSHVDATAALAAHNIFRAAHHAPPLIWDASLARYAENHASFCQFKHSNGAYGENLAAGYASISAAVRMWYAEGALYHYDQPTFTHATGHFTQVVWKASERLGCGYALCNGKGGTPGKFWVCEYSPAGNVINRGYFSRNVLARY